jgi:hypothetical protein
MKNLLLLVVALFGFATLAAPAYADGWGHGGRDRGDHGWFNQGDRDHHYYHGWVWGFAPPLWFVPGVTVCREYYTQRQVGYDSFGRPVFVTDQHVDCQDQFGAWIVIR